MSEEDQMRAAGRLALERSKAKKEQALIRATLDATAENLILIASGCKNPDDTNLGSVMAAIDRLMKTGGLEDIKETLRDLVNVSERVKVFDERARAAGID